MTCRSKFGVLLLLCLFPLLISLGHLVEGRDGAGALSPTGESRATGRNVKVVDAIELSADELSGTAAKLTFVERSGRQTVVILTTADGKFEITAL